MKLGIERWVRLRQQVYNWKEGEKIREDDSLHVSYI